MKDKDDRHYLVVARLFAIGAAILMFGIAFWLTTIEMKTFHHTGTILGAVMSLGLFGIYMLGFFGPLGDGRALFVALATTMVFSVWRAGITLEWWIGPGDVWYNTDDYFTGMIGHALVFMIGFLVAGTLQRVEKKKRDWTNLTVWTQDGEELQ